MLDTHESMMMQAAEKQARQILNNSTCKGWIVILYLAQPIWKGPAESATCHSVSQPGAGQTGLTPQASLDSASEPDSLP